MQSSIQPALESEC